MTKSKNNTLFIVILFLLFFGIYMMRKNTVEEDIMNKGKTTYGYIDDLRKASLLNKRSISHFFYFIDGKRYYEPFGNFPDDSIFDRIKIGGYYQVKYLEHNREKCLMLFGKPVLDTMQFVNP